MKGFVPKSLAIVVLVLLVWTLTKIANNTRINDNTGATFWLERQKVVECTLDDIILVDKHGSETHLDKDEDSWPDCSIFEKDQVMDFQLSRGAKTHYLKRQASAWWR